MGPHTVNIQFPKKVTIQEIRVYVDFHLDESYTPHKISILAGTNYHDLQEVHLAEFTDEPKKWFVFPLFGANGK